MSADKCVSIVIPVRNEEKYIRKCLDSLVNQDYDSNKFEIVVVDGMSTDKTRDILYEFEGKYSNIIKIIDNPLKSQVVGRNIGIKESIGDIILMFSGHAYAPSNYLSILTNSFRIRGKEVGIIGSNILIPGDESYMGKVLGHVQMSILGGGSSSFRVSKVDKFVDSPGFPAYRRKVIREVGLMDEKFVVGEDIDLNWRIKQRGYKILISKSLYIYYYRRHDKFSLICAHMFNYGIARGRFTNKHPKSIKLLSIIPSALIFCIIGSVLSYSLNNLLFEVFTLMLFLYLFLVLLSSFKILIQGGRLYYLVSIPLYFAEHSFFGVGFIIGLIYQNK